MMVFFLVKNMDTGRQLDFAVELRLIHTKNIPGSALQYPRQTRDLHPWYGKCFASVADARPTLNRPWVEVSCFLGWHGEVVPDIAWLLNQCWFIVGSSSQTLTVS